MEIKPVGPVVLIQPELPRKHPDENETPKKKEPSEEFSLDTVDISEEAQEMLRKKGEEPGIPQGSENFETKNQKAELYFLGDKDNLLKRLNEINGLVSEVQSLYSQYVKGGNKIDCWNQTHNLLNFLKEKGRLVTLKADPDFKRRKSNMSEYHFCATLDNGLVIDLSVDQFYNQRVGPLVTKLDDYEKYIGQLGYRVVKTK